jgi:hypothetical protein
MNVVAFLMDEMSLPWIANIEEEKEVIPDIFKYVVKRRLTYEKQYQQHIK